MKFADVSEVLPILSKEFRLGIFSQGVKWFQMGKLKCHEYSKYFSEDFIFIDFNKTSLLKKIVTKDRGSEIIIVDNEIGIINKVSHSGFKVRPIFLDRYSKFTDFRGEKISDFYELLRRLNV